MALKWGFQRGRGSATRPAGGRARRHLAERLLGELEADPRARRRLAELLVMEPDVRLAMINAIIADVATKRDLAELKGDINALKSEIG